MTFNLGILGKKHAKSIMFCYDIFVCPTRYVKVITSVGFSNIHSVTSQLISPDSDHLIHCVRMFLFRYVNTMHVSCNCMLHVQCIIFPNSPLFCKKIFCFHSFISVLFCSFIINCIFCIYMYIYIFFLILLCSKSGFTFCYTKCSDFKSSFLWGQILYYFTFVHVPTL